MSKSDRRGSKWIANFFYFFNGASLRYKLAIPLLLSSALLAVIVAVLSHTIAIDQLKTQLQKRAEVLSVTIKESAYVISDYAEMRFALEAITQRSAGVYGITLATRDPLILWASSFHPGGNEDEYTQDMLKMVNLANKHNLFGQFHHTNGDLIIVSPLKTKSNSLPKPVEKTHTSHLPEDMHASRLEQYEGDNYEGILYLRFDWQQIQQSTQNNLRLLISLVSLGILVTLILSLTLLYRYVLSPIKAINAVVDAQKSGGAKHRAHNYNNDEIGTLGKTLDTLLNNINERDFLLRSIIEHMPVALVLHDQTGKQTVRNHLHERWFSSIYGENDNTQPTISDHENLLRQVQEDKKARTQEETLTDESGDQRHFLTTAFPIEDKENQTHWLGSVSVDITQKKNDELQLQQFYHAIESVRNGILIADARTEDNLIIHVNPATELITGYSKDEFIGKNPRFLQKNKGDGKDQAEVAILRDALTHYHDCKTIIQNFKKDGTSFWNEISISIIRDTENTPTHFICVIDDVSERIDTEKRIQRMAYYDSLTNIPNRMLFNDRLTQYIAKSKRDKTQTAVLWIDLDGFKAVNDTYGHKTGDILLQQASIRMKNCLRQLDTIARMGGDEFTVLIGELKPSETRTAITTIASHLNQVLAKIFEIDGDKLRVSASIGVSIFPIDGKTPNDLVKNADQAMYCAKAKGKNNFQFFSEDMNFSSKQSVQIEKALRQALQKNELTLHYQPQVSSRNQAISSVEALLRWNSAELGAISPAVFIPIAETKGLIGEIGNWILKQACTDFREWQQRGLSIKRVAVNLSPYQLRDQEIINHIDCCLRDTGISANCLEVEVTESAMIDDFHIINNTLRKLKKTGVKVAIDDFGTGYSSLSYLKRLSVDTVKIDQSFIQGLPNDSDNKAIVSAVIGMAKGIGLTTIAEGVEELEQLNFLLANDCTIIQGYYYSKALPSSDLIHFLESRSNQPPNT